MSVESDVGPWTEPAEGSQAGLLSAAPLPPDYWPSGSDFLFATWACTLSMDEYLTISPLRVLDGVKFVRKSY